MKFPAPALGLALLGGCLLSCPATADCVDYELHMHWVTGLGVPGSAYDVAVSGTHAYLAESEVVGSFHGLHAIDISDPLKPRLVGRVETANWAVGVAVAGNYAYVTEDGAESCPAAFQVIDVSDSRNLRIVGGLALPRGPYDVAAMGSFAYVASGEAGLQVIDVSRPAMPRIVARVDTPGLAMGVTVGGDVLGHGPLYAYVADGNGVLVVELADPRNPRIVGSVALPGYVQNLDVAGSHAYVAAGSSLQVVDISNPRHPRIVGGVDTPKAACSVRISGGRAYVADDCTGVLAVDLSDPTRPKVIGDASAGFAYALEVVGSFIFVADYSAGLQVIEIGSGESVELIGSVPTPGRPQGVTVSGNYAYLGCGPQGLQVVDVTDPEHPVLVGGVDTPGWAGRPALLGTYACLTDGGSFVRVIDVSDPTSPELAAQMVTYHGAAGVAVDDRYAYVSEQYYFQVFDLLDPRHPQLVANLSVVPGGPITVAGGYAYVASPNDGLWIIRITDPLYPSPVGLVPMAGVTGLAVSGSYVYLTANDSNRLCIIDASVPYAPVLVSSLDSRWTVLGVAAAGHDVYVISYAGLGVVDVEDPLHPRVLGGGDTPDTPTGVDVANGVAYLSLYSQEHFSGLVVFPSQCPDRGTAEAPADPVEAHPSPLCLRVTPNPIRDWARLGFTLPAAGAVRAAIHDPSGRVVRILQDALLPAGPGRLDWDGRDFRGRSVAAGLYWARLSTPGGAETAKFVIMR